MTQTTDETTTVSRISRIIARTWSWDAANKIAKEIDGLHATIDRLQRELAEARAYISTIIDAPKDYPAEEGM